MGNWGSSPLGKAAGGMKLTTHLHLVPRSMRGAIPPLPQYVFIAWCLVKHKDNFFTFHLPRYLIKNIFIFVVNNKNILRVLNIFLSLNYVNLLKIFSIMSICKYNVKVFSSRHVHHHVQNGSGAHPASYPTGTRGSFPGGKAAGEWSWPLPSI
jgi:hypothetical protein